MAENYITEVDIRDEAKDNFLTYSSEVLTDRAIPAAEDGLLSVHRKLLWTMEQYLKMDNKGKTKKSASIVGSTLATSYFHGDAACYGALCKLAQEYLMRYPLVQGQGSLGTQAENGMQASARYTEAKPSIYADLMFNDFNKNVVPLKPTYNGEFYEPVILPSLFPNAIVNGREAIGISMSHNSLPHNLTEVCDAIIAYIKGEIENVDDLMKYILGPDFPLGGTIINGRDIRAALATGKSDISLKVRGDYTVEGQTITFTTIPYRVYRNKIKEQINNNIDVFEKYLDDFDDESSKGDNKLVFYIKKGVSTARALNQLFALTDLETTLSYNMNFIVDGTPKMCSMIDLLDEYHVHQSNVIMNVAFYDKEKATERKHIIEGLLKAIDKIDEVIATIKASADKDKARSALIKLLDIDDVQANAILDMRLSKLTKLDNKDLIQELKDKEAIIVECNKILDDKDYRNSKIIEAVEELKKKFGDERRTKITDIEIPKEEKEIVHVEPEKVVVVMTAAGNIKRVPAVNFKEQKRNTKGVKLQPDDITDTIIRTNTIDNLLVFTNYGKVYKLLVDDIPVGTNTSVGTPIGSLIEFEDGEQAEIIYSLYRETTAKYVLFVTADGTMKKVALSDFTALRRKSGVVALKLREGDRLAAVSLIDNEDILIITHKGQIIKLKTDFGAAGRTAIGIKAIGLNDGDEVVAALPIRNAGDNLAIFFENGAGKKVSLSELTTQNRGGKGVKIGKTGVNVSCATMVEDSDTLLANGSKNSVCLSAKELPLLGRTSNGNQIIKGDYVVSITKI